MEKVEVYDWKISNIGDRKVEYVDAMELITSSRIDLVAKYKFVEMYDNNWKVPFIEELYKAHLAAFSYGSFIESGQEKTKNTYEKYVKTFYELINDIKEKGFDENLSVIPVGDDNIILNGAHRVAIAAYYGLKVPIVRFEGYPSESNHFNAQFFERRLLEKRFLDYLLTEYIKLKHGVFVGIIWPAAGRKEFDRGIQIIRDRGFLIYEKDVNLEYQGIKNLMIQIYGHQKWCGSIENGYKEIKGKVDNCYRDRTNSHIVVLENCSYDDIVKLKHDIRGVFGIENHSIHICDNQDEAIQMAQLLLNSNSIHALNNADFLKNASVVEYIKEIIRLEKWLKGQKYDIDKMVIDSSAVMGVYGLRKPSDIDYLAMTYIDFSNYKKKMNTDEHDGTLVYHTVGKESLILDPDYYFYMLGLKFVSLKEICRMKRKRGEPKDIDDCRLIQTIEDTDAFRKKISRLLLGTKRIVMNTKVKCRRKIGALLRKVGIRK